VVFQKLLNLKVLDGVADLHLEELGELVIENNFTFALRVLETLVLNIGGHLLGHGGAGDGFTFGGTEEGGQLVGNGTRASETTGGGLCFAGTLLLELHSFGELLDHLGGRLNHLSNLRVEFLHLCKLFDNALDGDPLLLFHRVSFRFRSSGRRGGFGGFRFLRFGFGFRRHFRNYTTCIFFKLIFDAYSIWTILHISSRKQLI